MSNYQIEQERTKALEKADHEKSKSFLNLSIKAIDEQLADNRDWIRCRKFIQRIVPSLSYFDSRALLPCLPYSEYLKTEHWRKKRQRALTEARNLCRICNKGGELHTHHRTYDNLGHENDEDLIVLCADCHSLFHRERKLNADGEFENTEAEI